LNGYNQINIHNPTDNRNNSPSHTLDTNRSTFSDFDFTIYTNLYNKLLQEILNQIKHIFENRQNLCHFQPCFVSSCTGRNRRVGGVDQGRRGTASSRETVGGACSGSGRRRASGSGAATSFGRWRALAGGGRRE
jgi:hypothetical protein